MKKAFTLAETLIVIAIIGVIATLTLPNVMANYKKKVYVAQLQKAYNQLSNAVQQLMVDENADTLQDTYLFGNDNYSQFLKKYFKTTKICNENNYNECVVESYKNLNSHNLNMSDYNNWAKMTCAIINTGATICIGKGEHYTRNQERLVLIDVNGLDSPNIYGRDLFDMYLRKSGSLIADDWTSSSNWACKDGNIYSSGAGCFGRVQAAGWKMDY